MSFDNLSILNSPFLKREREMEKRIPQTLQDYLTNHDFENGPICLSNFEEDVIIFDNEYIALTPDDFFEHTLQAVTTAWAKGNLKSKYSELKEKGLLSNIPRRNGGTNPGMVVFTLNNNGIGLAVFVENGKLREKKLSPKSVTYIENERREKIRLMNQNLKKQIIGTLVQKGVNQDVIEINIHNYNMLKGILEIVENQGQAGLDLVNTNPRRNFEDIAFALEHLNSQGSK